MQKMNISLNRFFIILTLFSTTATAQEKRDNEKRLSYFETELFKKTELFLSTDNAAGLSLGGKQEFSDIRLGVGYDKGDYHRPQQPEKNTNYRFDADGAINLGKYYLIGGFKFKQSFEKDVRFTSILNPYRGTPYIIADSTGGDWQKQAYAMSLKGASPLFFNLVSFGLELGLDVERGAKKIDPRPQSNSNNISAAPSFAFKLGNHEIGANMLYRRFHENTNLMLYDTGNPQKIYLLKGLGQYTYDIFTTTERERQYRGDGWGAAIQYGFRTSDLHLLIYGKYDNYAEIASDIENSKPRKRGKLYETVYNAGFTMNIQKNRDYMHCLKGDYIWQERSGREIIQVYNSSTDVNAWYTVSEAPRRSVNLVRAVSAEYDFSVLKNKSTEKWRFGIKGQYTDYSDKYAVLDSYIRFKQAVISLNGLRNVLIGEKQYMQINIGAGYGYVWDKSFHYTEREPEDMTIGNFISEDMTLLWMNHYYADATVLYGYKLKNRSSVYTSLGYRYSGTNEKLSRNGVLFSIGYQF